MILKIEDLSDSRSLRKSLKKVQAADKELRSEKRGVPKLHSQR